MTTAITVRKDEALPQVRLGRADEGWSFADLMKMGDTLVKTGFLPEHVKNAGQCAAIILTGRELGMPPMRSLRSLQVIKGKVVESADSQLARFKSDGGRAVFTRLDDSGAVLQLRHPNGDEHTETFGPEDAKRAGLTSDNYRKHPRAMYRSRAITAGLKSVGWEGGAGIYEPQEAAEFLPNVAIPSMDAPTDAPESGEVSTPKQREFFAKLMQSHVFTDDERKRALWRIDHATKLQAIELIARAEVVIQERKAAEAEEGSAQEPEEVGAA